MHEHWPLAERYSSLWVGGSAQQIEMFGFMMCRLIYYLVFFSTLTFHCRGWPLSRLLSSVLTLMFAASHHPTSCCPSRSSFLATRRSPTHTVRLASSWTCSENVSALAWTSHSEGSIGFLLWAQTPTELWFMVALVVNKMLFKIFLMLTKCNLKHFVAWLLNILWC